VQRISPASPRNPDNTPPAPQSSAVRNSFLSFITPPPPLYLPFIPLGPSATASCQNQGLPTSRSRLLLQLTRIAPPHSPTATPSWRPAIVLGPHQQVTPLLLLIYRPPYAPLNQFSVTSLLIQRACCSLVPIDTDAINGQHLAPSNYNVAIGGAATPAAQTSSYEPS
jgi:hypothetical protein